MFIVDTYMYLESMKMALKRIKDFYWHNINKDEARNWAEFKLSNDKY